MATAAVARLERPGRAVPGAAARLRWANAGHPPPMVAVPDGGVRVLGADVGDLMLGVDPRVRRREGLLQLPPSSTLLLYTDGLVERRGTTLDEGTDRLRATLAELARCPVDELSDALLDRMLDGTPQDDVALVALRLTAPPGA
jgi:serine phosphatase RsbU (regulator of sigma subunit)